MTMSFLQLGFTSMFLSEPVLSGYTSAAAIHVFTNQLQHITGLSNTVINVTQGPLCIPKVKKKKNFYMKLVLYTHIEGRN